MSKVQVLNLNEPKLEYTKAQLGWTIYSPSWSLKENTQIIWFVFIF